MILAISGNDCSGKSTQVDLLKAHLEGQVKRVRILWHRPGYSRGLIRLKQVARWFMPGALPGADQPAARQAAFSRNGVQRAWRWMAILDIAFQHGIKLRLLRALRFTVICDRYWLDAMLDLELRFPGWRADSTKLFGWIRALLVRPDTWVLLTLPWEEVLRRSIEKNEPFADSLEVRRERFDRYASLETKGPWTCVSSEGAAAEVHQRVVDLVRGGNFTSSPHGDEQRSKILQHQDVLGVGPYPPPITGQAVAFKTVVDGLGLDHVSIGGRLDTAPSRFSLNRAFQVFGQTFRAWRSMRGRRLLYITTASSFLGAIKDGLIVFSARLRGLDVVAHVHQGCFNSFLEELPDPVAYLVRRMYRAMRSVIILSPTFSEQFGFLKPGQLRIVPNSAGPDPKRRASAPTQRIQVLFLSNLMVSKGTLDVIEAMSYLPESYHLVLAGEFVSTAEDAYPSVEALKRAAIDLVCELNLGERVTWAGVVRGAQKADLLADSHVLALPTRYHHEAQPLCVAEAMLAGLPVVATAHRDLVVMVDESRGACIADTRPTTIAAGILDVCESEEDWSARSANARAFALARHREEVHLGGISTVLGLER